MRDRLAGCQRTSLQHRFEYPFGHASRSHQEEDGGMKSREELHQELRRRVLSLPGVTGRQNAGIHARDENDLAPAMELIRMSYDHFAAEGH
jgi:hypothetical protein